MFALKSTLLTLGTSALLAAAASAQSSSSSRTTPPQPNPESPPTGPRTPTRTDASDDRQLSGTSSSGSTSSMTGGQSGARTSSASSSQMAEQQFLARLSHDNESEIEMAKLSKDQASSPRVKQFADQLVRDHEHAADLVKDCAKKKDIDLSPPSVSSPSAATAMKDKSKAEIDKLKSLKGEDFDREFIRQMVSDHERTIRDVTAARTQFSDPQLTQLIDHLLPKLKQHLATARALEKGASKAS